MTFLQKVLLGVCLILAGVYGGWRLPHKPEVQVQTVTKTVVQVQEKVVLKDHIITKTVIKTPDGKVIEQTTDEVKDKESSKSVNKEKVASKPNIVSKTTYSLGVLYDVPLSLKQNPYDPRNLTLDLGYRVVWGLWVVADYHIGAHSLALGVRYEF